MKSKTENSGATKDQEKWWKRRVSPLKYIALIVVIVLVALLFKDKIQAALNPK